MKPQEAIKKLDAVMTSNRAMAWVDGKRVIVAKFVDNEMVFTPEGEKLAIELEAAPKKAKADTKKVEPTKVEPEKPANA